ncbi:FAD-dependent monooxygenase [Marisediminicola senii]|uniref:FAD-dependent monooxygenase n=1 Tax=Marisediminicola senii TaxID=2711233 RepID=UPI0013EA6FF7|nr:FAD-dependent monooxygenase [Marisediminicola senii]
MATENLPPTDLQAEVLVVGAGPTGLMLATWLRRLGVDVIVVDRKGGPTRESRALVLQARSLELYDQLGIVAAVRAASVRVRQVAPGWERRVLAAVHIGRPGAAVTPYPGLHVLEQSENERILYETLRSHGGEVLWQHALEGLEVHHGEAAGTSASTVASARRPGAAGGDAITIGARFVVGADGSGSAVRRLSGIHFDGSSSSQVFFVCDATAVRGLVEGAVNLRLGRRRFLLAFPMGSRGDARLLGLSGMPTDAPAGDVEAAVRRGVGTTFGVEWGGSRWFSQYRVHHRVAASFRRGPVLLAGDAAHVHSPVGAQGMNTGLQDAHNLAMKLAEVVRGTATESSLDAYERERRPVAERLIGTTDRAFGLITSPRLLPRLARMAIAVVVPVVAGIVPRTPAGTRAFEYLGQLRIHYAMPGEGVGRSGDRRRRRRRRDPIVGRRLRWTGANFAALRSATWQVHTYGSETLAKTARNTAASLGLDAHGYPAHRPFDDDTLYLVRPDGFVAARARMDAADEVFRRSLLAHRGIRN